MEIFSCRPRRTRPLRLSSLLIFLLLASSAVAASVWKVTAPTGATIFLGGSVHGLRGTDYPLPSAYNRAFDATSALVLEDDPDVSIAAVQKLFKSGLYPKNDSLKNHIDPRTYDYLRRFFALGHVPESRWSRCKPWMLIVALWAPATNQLGVEAYLIRRAHANHKAIFGLESTREHLAVLAGLPDEKAEIALLLNFVPEFRGTAGAREQKMAAWRNGDVDTLARLDEQGLRDMPSFQARLIDDRNRNWIPKIEGYLEQRRNYFVVAGAGHFGGSNGVLALLRRAGYRIETL